MKVLFYCQHVLGIGHLFRTLAICKGLDPHPVTLVTGGEPVEVPMPGHVREERLPGLMMDAEFTGLFNTGVGRAVERVRQERRRRLWDLFRETGPDLFLIELFPFGRKKFGFELDPLLEGIRARSLPSARVVCSLRDILVEKKDHRRFEKRVIASINRHFDALLVHSDPGVIRLDETFTRVGEIRIPVVYTGFVTDRPAPDARRRLRAQLQVSDGEQLVVASAGGGKVGQPLLVATVRAFAQVANERRVRLVVFTGPFLEESRFSDLQRIAGRDVQVSRFTREFPAYLAAADLSVSMAGYNTCMNVLAAGVPALVWPFAQNREQRLRAERLQAAGALEMLADADLHPPALAARMARRLAEGVRTPPRIDLEGAAHSAQWLTTWLAGES